jgi:hypothetical protein
MLEPCFSNEPRWYLPLPGMETVRKKILKSHNSVIVFDDHHAVVKVRCGPTELSQVYKTFFIRNLQMGPIR